MNVKEMTLNQIRRAGIQMLTRNLGPVGMIRFLQQNDLGWGNYTKDCTQWLGNPSLDEIADGIATMRKAKPKG